MDARVQSNPSAKIQLDTKHTQVYLYTVDRKQKKNHLNNKNAVFL
jgi:hypothetical protein